VALLPPDGQLAAPLATEVVRRARRVDWLDDLNG